MLETPLPVALFVVVDMVRWLWGTSVQAFLDRDGAVGPDGFPPNARDRPGCGSMGTPPCPTQWPWLFKAGGHASDLGLLLLHRHVFFLDPPHLWCELRLQRS